MPTCEVLSRPWGAQTLLWSQSQRLRPGRRPHALPLVLADPDSVTVYVTSFFCARETRADIHRCGQRGVGGCDIEGHSHQDWVPALSVCPMPPGPGGRAGGPERAVLLVLGVGKQRASPTARLGAH